jgi:ribonuclease BN (tRNA processing enzyme)
MNASMILTILGSGTGVPRADRSAPGLVVQAGETPVLMDSGSGSAYQLARAGIHYHQLDHLFYSHYAHPDHVNDLAELIFANNYFDPRRHEPLNVYGPPGMKDFYRRLVDLFPILGAVDFPVMVHELAHDCVTLGGLTIRTRPLSHQHVACVGYRLEHEGKSIIYSGDTDYCESLIDLAREGEVLVVECSFPDEHKVAGHLTSAEVGNIARRAGVKKVVLTHLYPLSDEVDVVAQVRAVFQGEVIKAEDLMQIFVA